MYRLYKLDKFKIALNVGERLEVYRSIYIVNAICLRLKPLKRLVNLYFSMACTKLIFLRLWTFAGSFERLSFMEIF